MAEPAAQLALSREVGPGVTVTDGVQGGEPCLANSRMPTWAPAELVADHRSAGHDLDDAIEHAREAFPHLGHREILICAAFEAGRRYARETSQAEQTVAAVRRALEEGGVAPWG